MNTGLKMPENVMGKIAGGDDPGGKLSERKAGREWLLINYAGVPS